MIDSLALSWVYYLLLLDTYYTSLSSYPMFIEWETIPILYIFTDDWIHVA